VIDYHEEGWPDQVLAITGGAGVSAAVNAAPAGAGDAIRAVSDGGRLATITSDPPSQERGIIVSSVYVRPDGGQLSDLAQLLAAGQLKISAREPTGFSTPPMRSRRRSAGTRAGRSRSRSNRHRNVRPTRLDVAARHPSNREISRPKQRRL
jgi:NADPH:quinone reductase-like Zn-dependent oxidoreductase